LTDDRGTFAIEAALGRAVVVARADGYVSEQKELVVIPGRANPNLHFSLTPAATISGRVLDLDGKGVAGVRVWVHYRGDARSWRFAEETAGQTDELGSFTIPVVARGRTFVLHAESEGWLLSSSQNMTIRAPEHPGVLLQLTRRGGSVSGRVLDSAGRAVQGAQVQLRALPAEDEFTAEQRESVAFSRNMNRIALSREDGSYSFEGVPRGRIVVTAQAESRRAASDTDIEPGRQTRLDLSLR
jgi:protocatechuate 3,4-dioxygenase beta subunit